jgi:hypothetical protein
MRCAKRWGTSWNTAPLPIPNRPTAKNRSATTIPSGGDAETGVRSDNYVQMVMSSDICEMSDRAAGCAPNDPAATRIRNAHLVIPI